MCGLSILPPPVPLKGEAHTSITISFPIFCLSKQENINLRGFTHKDTRREYLYFFAYNKPFFEAFHIRKD